jgi:putative membrane protein
MRIFAGVVVVVGTVLIAFAQQPNTGQQPASTSPNPSSTDPLPGGMAAEKSGTSGDNMSHAKALQMDKRFLQETVLSSLTLIDMGKLAAEKGSTEAVKQFGQKMVQDHTRGLEYLKKTAARDGVPVADALDAKHKEAVDKLAKLSGPEFDRAYVRYQVKNHEKRVSQFQEESDNGTETGAKNLATRMLPAVQQHLNDAKDLNKSLSAVAAK